jgi:hypothetical protein
MKIYKIYVTSWGDEDFGEASECQVAISIIELYAEFSGVTSWLRFKGFYRGLAMPN